MKDFIIFNEFTVFCYNATKFLALIRNIRYLDYICYTFQIMLTGFWILSVTALCSMPHDMQSMHYTACSAGGQSMHLHYTACSAGGTVFRVSSNCL